MARISVRLLTVDSILITGLAWIWHWNSICIFAQNWFGIEQINKYCSLRYMLYLYLMHNNLLVQPWPSSCQFLQPTHKRFNSAYLQNQFCICRKIPSNTLGLYATFFLLIASHHDFLKTKKIGVRFPIMEPRQACQAKKTSSYWKFIEVTHSGKAGRGRGSVVIIILLQLFFFNIPDLFHRCTAAPVAAKNHR